MENTSGQPEDFRKRAEEAAREAMILATGGDNELIAHVVRILVDISKLAPSITRLQQIAENPNHPLFTSPNADISPELKEHMAVMRRKQVGAIMHALKTIVDTQKKTMQELPKIDADAKKRAIDASLKNLGID